MGGDDTRTNPIGNSYFDDRVPALLDNFLLILHNPYDIKALIGQSEIREHAETVKNVLDYRWSIAYGGLLVFLGCIVLTLSGPYAGGADSSGYLNSARLLCEGRIKGDMRVPSALPADAVSNLVFKPLGFKALPGADYLVPFYPVGFPLHLAAGRWLSKENGTLIVLLIISLANSFLTMAAGRLFGLSDPWNFIAAMLMAFNPLFLSYALIPMSDVLAAGWCLTAVMLAWLSEQRYRLAILCGAACSIAVLVRPTNVLVLLPVAFLLRSDLRRWVLVVMGGLPGAAFLCFYQWMVYGSPLSSGYDGFGRLFSGSYFFAGMNHFAHWVSVCLTPAIPVLFGLSFLNKGHPKRTALLYLWAGSFVLFYAFYRHSTDSWLFTRFILPAFPPIVIGGCLTGQHLSTRLQNRFTPLNIPKVKDALYVFMVFCLLVYICVLDIKRGVHKRHITQRLYSQAADWASTNLPRDTIIFCMEVSGSFYYYTNFVLARWDHIEKSGWEQWKAISGEKSGPPIVAALFPYETTEEHALRDFIPGDWEKIGEVKYISFFRLQN